MWKEENLGFYVFSNSCLRFKFHFWNKSELKTTQCKVKLVIQNQGSVMYEMRLK